MDSVEMNFIVKNFKFIHCTVSVLIYLGTVFLEPRWNNFSSLLCSFSFMKQPLKKMKNYLYFLFASCLISTFEVEERFPQEIIVIGGLSETHRRTLGDPLVTNMSDRRPFGDPSETNIPYQRPIVSRHALFSKSDGSLIKCVGIQSGILVSDEACRSQIGLRSKIWSPTRHVGLRSEL